MTTRLVLRCLLPLALCGCIFAQVGKPPAGGGGGGGGGNGNIGTPGRTNSPSLPTTLPGNNTNAPDFSQHPLFLTGKVMMEDGTPTPEGVMIQLICRSAPHSIGRADSKGSFSIDLNNRAAMMTMADASDTSSASYGGGPIGATGNGISNSIANGQGQRPTGMVGDRDLMGCDLQAALPGFRSDVLHLDNRRRLDDPNVGTLILHRLANVEGTTISATSAMAPKDARKAAEKGLNAIKKDKWDEARREFEKAVAIYPKFATAWVDLGRAQEHMKDFEAARHSYAQALEADSKLATPYLALAAMAANSQRWQEVSDQTDRLLKLNPLDFPEGYLLNSLSNYHLKHPDLAEKSAREGISHDAEHRFPKMHEVLGVLLAQRQDYAGAAEQLRQYLHYAPNSPDAELAKKQLAQIEQQLNPQAKKQ